MEINKELYQAVSVILNRGKFNFFELYNDYFRIDFKCDVDINIEEFQINNKELIQILLEESYSQEIEDIGARIKYELDKRGNIILIYYAMADHIWHSDYGIYDTMFYDKFCEIEFLKYATFSHSDYSIDNFYLSIDIYAYLPLKDFSLKNYSLKYKFNGLEIDISNKDLKNIIIDCLLESLSELCISGTQEKYNGVFEFDLCIENNIPTRSLEYYNKKIYTLEYSL